MNVHNNAEVFANYINIQLINEKGGKNEITEILNISQAASTCS